jgi:hypothetical protein
VTPSSGPAAKHHAGATTKANSGEPGAAKLGAAKPKSSAESKTNVSPALDSESAEDAAEEAPPSVQLEDPEPSQGHFIAVGVHGIGAMAFDESRGTRDPTFGKEFTLRLGESLTDWLSLSLAFGFGDTYGKPQDYLTLGRFGITSQWYFTERWFVQAGFGAASVQGPDPEDHDLRRGRYGDVYLTGLGYNFYISDNDQSGGWVFTPMLTAVVGPDSKFTTSSLSLGVELSWWGGLTRDKLNLPTSKAYDKQRE